MTPPRAYLDDQGTVLRVVNANTARRGALSPDLYATLNRAFETAADPRVRAVILTSEGGFFCAGGDLNLLAERRRLPHGDRLSRIEDLHDIVRALRMSPVPVIAAIEGGAAGAGLSLALACDLLVASEDAVFSAAYVKAGLVPDAGLTASLARCLPRPLAMEMCLMGRPVAAARLHAMGVVNTLCAPGAADTTAARLAQNLAQGPRDAQGVIRRLVAAAYETSEAAQLDAERDAMARAVAGSEAAEGIDAFLAKRKPEFG